MKTFKEQIEAVIEGRFPEKIGLTVSCTTPDCLLNVGCDNLPILMGQKHVLNCSHEFVDALKDSYHGLDEKTLAQVPEKLENPVFIFDSDKRKDTVVAVLDLYDSLDQPIMVCIHVNGSEEYLEGKCIEVNYITSIYGKRQNGIMCQFSNALRDGRLLYYDAEMVDELSQKVGFPVSIATIESQMASNTYQQSMNAVESRSNREFYNSFYAAGYKQSYKTRYTC